MVIIAHFSACNVEIIVLFALTPAAALANEHDILAEFLAIGALELNSLHFEAVVVLILADCARFESHVGAATAIASRTKVHLDRLLRFAPRKREFSL